MSMRLFQRGDSDKAQSSPRSGPVLLELGAMLPRPLHDQALGPWMDPPVQGTTIQRETSGGPGVVGVEVGRLVFRVVHADHDAVELGDPRHAPKTRPSAGRFPTCSESRRPSVRASYLGPPG